MKGKVLDFCKRRINAENYISFGTKEKIKLGKLFGFLKFIK